MPTIEYVYKNGAPKDESEIEDIVENDTQSEKVDEEKAKKEAEEKARLEKEAEDKKKLEEERLKKEAEEKARLEAEEKARLEAEEKAKKEAEKERLAKEAEEKTKKEAEEKAKREAEEKRLEEEKAKEAEEKARLEAEEKARLEKEAEEKARKEKEEKERLAKEAEEKAKREAEEKARKEALEQAKKEAEEKVRKDAEEKERLEKEAAERAKKEAEEKECLEKERLEKEAEEKAKRETEEQARLEKERLAKETEEKVKKEAEEKVRKETEEKERLEKEAEEKEPAKPSALERLLQSTPTMTIEPAQPSVDEEYEEPVISPSERMLCSGVLTGSVTECALVHDTPTYTCTFTRDFASRQHNPPNQKEQWTSAIPYSRFRALHNYYHHVYPAVSFPKLPSPVKKANKKQLDAATAEMNNYLQGILNLRNSGRIDTPFVNEQVPAEDALLRDVLQMVMRGYGIHNPLGQKEGGVRVKLVLDNEAPFGFLKDEDRIALQNDCCADCGARIGGKRSGGGGV